MKAAAAFEVEFLDKLQRLLAEGDFTATYKFAVLLGLVELSVEASPGTDVFTTRQLAEKVIELYWPQSLPYEGVELQQNPHRQARILTAVARFRGEAARAGCAALPLQAAARQLDEFWRRLLDEVEWSLVEMPLPRLQRLPSGKDEFLYSISWTLEDVQRSATSIQREVRAQQRGRQSGFDNRIEMQPGVVAALARFHGIVRDLVEPRWIRKVRELNGLALGERDLHAHLFGLERAQLIALCSPLRELHDGRCFYCGGRLVEIDIDHFLPWARYPENRLENLVPTHARCNQSKSAHLAAVEHLDRWLRRFVKQRDELAEISRAAGWPMGGVATPSISRLLYAQQPEEARLWFAKEDFRTWKHAEVHRQIASTLAQLSVA
jgi:hypothetical protein